MYSEHGYVVPQSRVAWILVATSGNVTDEVWKKYVEDQKPEEPDVAGLGAAAIEISGAMGVF